MVASRVWLSTAAADPLALVGRQHECVTRYAQRPGMCPGRGIRSGMAGFIIPTSWPSTSASQVTRRRAGSRWNQAANLCSYTRVSALALLFLRPRAAQPRDH